MFAENLRERKHSDGLVHRLFNKLIAQRTTDRDCAAETSVKISTGCRKIVEEKFSLFFFFVRKIFTRQKERLRAENLLEVDFIRHLFVSNQRIQSRESVFKEVNKEQRNCPEKTQGSMFHLIFKLEGSTPRQR